METSTLQRIKSKASKLFEGRLLQAGRVLEVRIWDSGNMVEIDLHLPEAEMAAWTDVPYIKFKVADLTYRDYTPFGWDAETSTCTILVETGHKGIGAIWAEGLKQNDTVYYLKIDRTQQAPHPTNLVVALGDGSSMAHLLALRQLTTPVSRFMGAVLMPDKRNGHLFNDYFRSPAEPLSTFDKLTDWLRSQEYCTPHTSFYLTGNHQLVRRIRSLLRANGHPSEQILTKGFWS